MSAFNEVLKAAVEEASRSVLTLTAPAPDRPVERMEMGVALPSTTGADLCINQAEMMLLDKGVSDYTKLTATTDTAKVYGAARDLRMHRIRMGAIWSYIEPTKGNYNWVDLDRAVIVAAQYGLKPHLTLGLVTPNWSPTTTDFGDMCKTVAARYGSAGMNLVESYEILNEQNNVGNFSPCTPAHYVPYLKAAYVNIHAVHPAAIVVSGGLEPINDGFFSVSPLNFLKGMYTSGAQGYFDALGNHPYSIDYYFNQIEPTLAGTFLAMDDALYALMVANGDGAKQIWWTEMGFAVPPSTLAQQAAWMPEQINLWLNNKPHVGPCFIYNVRNSGTDTSNGNNNFGMLNYDYSQRPVYAAVKAISANGSPAGFTASATFSTSVGFGAAYTASTFLSAGASVVAHVSAKFDAGAALAMPLFGRPEADFGGEAKLQATALQSFSVAASFTTGAQLAASADTEQRRAAALSVAAKLTATVGQQSLFSYQFDGTGSVKPSALFNEFGQGYSVGASQLGVADNNNAPTVDGTYYSGGIYKQPQGSPDHLSEVCTAPLGSGYSGLPDRSNLAVVRANLAGTQMVFSYGHWGGGGSTAIVTLDGGVLTVRATSTDAWQADTDKMRLIADGNTYTVYKNGVATPCTWTDNTMAYAGAANLHTGFGFQHLFASGLEWAAPGISHLWLGQDVRVTLTPGTANPTAAFAVSATLAAVAAPVQSARASFTAAASLTAAPALTATATFSTGATLTATTSPRYSVAANFAVAPAYAAVAYFGKLAAFAAGAALTAAVSTIQRASAPFAAGASLGAASIASGTVNAPLSAATVLSAGAVGVQLASAVFSGSASLSATSTESHSVAATFTAIATLADTVKPGAAAAFGATVGLTAAVSSVNYVPAAFGATVGLAMLALQPGQWSYVFSSGIKPALTDAGQTGPSAAAGGVLNEGSVSNFLTVGEYYGLALWPTQSATSSTFAQVTQSGLGSARVGIGPAVAFDSAGNNGVFAIIEGQPQANCCQIFTKVGNVYTPVATSATITGYAADRFAISVTPLAGIYTYRLFKNGVDTGLAWTDDAQTITPGGFEGAAFESQVSGGNQYKSPGVTAISGGDAVLASAAFAASTALAATPAQIVTAPFTAGAALAASAMPGMKVTATFTMGAVLAATDYPSMSATAALTAGTVFSATAKQSVTVSANFTTTAALSATTAPAATTPVVSAALTAGAALSAAVAQKVSTSYTFTTTKPTGITDTGQLGASTISSSHLKAGAAPSPNGSYSGASLSPTLMGTSLYTATVTPNAGDNEYYAGTGVAIGFDSTGANGLLFTMCALSNFMNTCQVIVKTGNTYTTVYTSNSPSENGDSNPVLSVQITFDGTHYVYTPSYNGSVITAATWTDTNNVLGTPGPRWGAAWRALYNSGNYSPNSVKSWAAADT